MNSLFDEQRVLRIIIAFRGTTDIVVGIVPVGSVTRIIVTAVVAGETMVKIVVRVLIVVSLVDVVDLSVVAAEVVDFIVETRALSLESLFSKL